MWSVLVLKYVSAYQIANLEIVCFDIPVVRVDLNQIYIQKGVPIYQNDIVIAHEGALHISLLSILFKDDLQIT
jgi:hypothetical protein